MEKTNNYILGLDLGITSVGFGIIEKDTYRIIKYGVRLFDENNADNNSQERRKFRGGRRLKSRKTNRINAIKHLLINDGIIGEEYLTNNYQKFNNVYELRVKGLHEKLTSDELANVLINIAKKRGSSLEVAIDENEKEAKAYGSLTKNTLELLKNNQFICEHQLAKLQSNVKIRTNDNIYKTEDYIKEVEQILSNQGLPQDLNKKIIEIIGRRRNFSEGPGSEKFPTSYGSYRYEIVDGKKSIVHVNLIDVMKGKCSIFKDEPRIAKNTYTACLFNLLNDLNNLKINNNPALTTEQKKEIITKFVNEKGGITIAQLYKYLNTDKDKITGFRIDKNQKPLISTFDTFKKIKGILPNRITSNITLVDEIIEILTKTLVVEQRKSEINDLLIKYSESLCEEELDKLCNLTKINGYHSLSKKAMDLIIPELIETNKNQMQIITDNKLGQNKEVGASSKIEFDDELILSPVAKRVHREALKVLNELRKEYGEFDSIVIETTRAKNSKEEKQFIIDNQKRFEEQKKKVEEIFLELEKDPSKYSNQTKLKLRMYKEQEGKTIYAGLPIDIDTLLNDETAYQIEHIIPYAVSFDNSYNNKALASAKENQDKGKRSPWGYFSSGMVGELNGSITCWSEFESIISANPNLSKTKKLNLLNQEDVSKYANMQEFVARNLIDTSYAIRSIMTTIKNYCKINNIDSKVYTVKGKFTSDFRNKVGLKKDRDFYIHHAIDALIIAGSKNQKMFNKAYQFETIEETTYYKETGETVDFDASPLEDKQFLQFVNGLKDIKSLPEYFSYKVDRKTNRQFADQTIYSTRKYEDGEYVIKNYGDIYGKDGESLKKLFVDQNSDKLLMYRNDIETYNLFKEIYEFYKNEKNPFAKYKEEHGPIRKYSKKGNGPIITKVKYIDSKLGNHLSISKNYNVSNKNVVLLQTSPYRTDIYQSKDGTYKFLTIRRYHVKQINEINVIDSKLYNQLKTLKNINDEDQFLFSLNRNDIINLIRLDDNDTEKNKQLKLFRFIATNNDKTNTIEIKKIECKTEKQTMISIGKKIVKLEKYNVSPTGKWFKVEKEVLKLEWK